MKKLAEGREAEMFEWADGAILRLIRDKDAQRANEMQAAAIDAARASGLAVPRVLGMTSLSGRPGLVMERVQGANYLTILGHQPWLVFAVGNLLGRVHARLHEAVASEALPPLRATLRRRIESCGELPTDLKQFALRRLEGLPDGDRLCHGDFHPGNMLRTGQGPVVIDWASATRGDPDADVARTNLMVQVGEPPPGSPIVVRTMARIGGRLLLWRYLHTYRLCRSFDAAEVARWEVPVAAARLADGIQGEAAGLIRHLERARSEG